MLLRQFKNPFTGKPVQNHYVVWLHEKQNVLDVFYGAGTLFQSYDTIVAFKYDTGKVVLDKWHWKYSTTTSKYRNMFLGETTKETEAKIKAGKYTLGDLN